MPDLMHWLPALIALVAIAVAWGATREAIAQLTRAVEKLTTRIDQMPALAQTDALHEQRIATLEREAGVQRDRTHALASDVQVASHRADLAAAACAELRAAVERASSAPPRPR